MDLVTSASAGQASTRRARPLRASPYNGRAQAPTGLPADVTWRISKSDRAGDPGAPLAPDHHQPSSTENTTAPKIRRAQGWRSSQANKRASRHISLAPYLPDIAKHFVTGRWGRTEESEAVAKTTDDPCRAFSQLIIVARASLSVITLTAVAGSHAHVDDADHRLCTRIPVERAAASAANAHSNLDLGVDNQTGISFITSPKFKLDSHVTLFRCRTIQTVLTSSHHYVTYFRSRLYLYSKLPVRVVSGSDVKCTLYAAIFLHPSRRLKFLYIT
ncbi:hypothetical protein B0H16DRAFT_1901901 [Mycena metata]|uniref:Uncharacterized protein n=1 Tax=Mycena metata TaxID=1033252 RepID=A0AAD7GTU9_9AGAR|nr:hypothetical protein B0H16DRAFT_1901901 [Mycena metata]